MNKIKIKIIARLILASFLASFLFPTISKAVEYNFGSEVNQELWQLNQDINEKRSTITELNKQIDVYKKNITAKQRELNSLSNQVATINESIAKINLEVATIELEKETAALQIENTNIKIQAKEKEISEQKAVIAEILRTVHREQQNTSLLEVLLMNNNFSDFIGEIKRMEDLQDTLLSRVEDLQKIKLSLTDEKKELEANQDELLVLAERLASKKESLSGQKIVKANLLEQTHGQEASYQALLEQARQEQQQLNSDIVYLEQTARERLNRQLEQQELNSDGFMWPVPSQIVTATFHDPDYPYRYIFEHPAIDIKAAQGTAIRAIDSGYVAKAKDGGQTGYSYIMLVHADGLSSVYGHVNVISVEEDQFISKGQIIGYSGGMPGTRGAGPFTTGPHLHLEVRLNGIPVNPLNYLP
ncbi:peptidoglycan DD-metalloendopeptidase family protein [Candidatus Nomurabacteria bacterium]|nr:peptidoglycan DD-metalloendopeptidase family protein [Candidatus Nomurabacteria bacterium]